MKSEDLGKTSSGKVITIRKVGWQSKLYVGGYPQSNGYFRSLWRRVLNKVGDYPNIKHVLVLGLGGGDLIKLLPKSQVTVVENESNIIRVFRKYFLEQNKRVRIVEDDAKEYVAKETKKYDLVIVDLYDGNEIPQFVEDKRFLKKLSKLMKLNSTLLVNYASYGFDQMDIISYEELLKTQFSSIKRLSMSGHHFFVAKNVRS